MLKKSFIFIGLLCFILEIGATTNVNPGSGNLSKAISAATNGDVLILSTGEYAESSAIEISKDITIQAANGATPVINLTAGWTLINSLKLQGLTVNADDVSVLLQCKNASPKYKVTIDNCLFTASSGVFVKASDNGEDASSYMAEVTIYNSTFNRTATSTTDSRMIDIRNPEQKDGVVVTIDHCTFFGGASERGVYLPYIGGAKITNCIYSLATNVPDTKSFCMYGSSCLISHSISFNSELYVHDAKNIESSVRNPYFVDPTNNNFQLYKNSPAVGTATNGSNMGDPRWGVSSEEFDESMLPLEQFVVKYPYSMAPTTSSLKILWELNNMDVNGKVYYGTDPDNLNLVVSTTDGMAIEGEGFIHIATLTGLKPGTRYYYQVGNAKRKLDHIGSAKTAPNPNTAFRIFTISDIHVNACKNWSNMQDFICTLDADLMMCNGDFVNEGNARDWNDALFTPGKPFLSQTVMMSAPGNHETGDPNTYRYSTFYDYFHQFSHGYSEDSIKDPRGESYFAYDYGNARIIAVNVNGDPSSPSHLKGSKQYNWIKNELETAKQDWILIFGHVGLSTSAYHGQWPPEGRDAWRTLFEEAVKNGKKVIYFCGDDHSFEHLYKDGVHYVRPGCGRNSNYTQVTSLKDAQYSMFFQSISCYSTLDMAADGSELHLTTRDSASNVFYEYTFKKEGETITPSMQFLSPNDEVYTADSTRIQWFAFNPKGDCTISLYYTDKQETANGNLIVSNLPATPKDKRYYYWQTRQIPEKGKYYIYGVISNGETSYSALAPGTITLEADTTAPAAPRLTGDIRNGQYFLAWENPTRPILTTVPLTNLKETIEPFAVSNEDGATMTIAREDNALRVDYDFQTEWKTCSTDIVFDNPTNISQTPTFNFPIKGNGTSTDLRVEVKNMCNGNEDWWYKEESYLKNKNWVTYSEDLTSLMAYDWYENADDVNRLDQVVKLCITLSVGSACKGTFYVGECFLSGQTSPAPDFQATIIVRNENHFPENPIDGEKIYEGTAETFVDASADITKTYYYGAFAYDDLGNMSKPNSDSKWLSSNLNPKASLESVTEKQAPRKIIQNGNVYIIKDNNKYSLLGTMVD